ncbi:eukaryotic translation initiation factor 4E [Pezoporus occidentalis]|uniref:eukaryotic translation initiation factor 4E n=1 Tax=Pezoporus occidentalis TaxID=407982 RepID=UPI002F910F74
MGGEERTHAGGRSGGRGSGRRRPVRGRGTRSCAGSATRGEGSLGRAGGHPGRAAERQREGPARPASRRCWLLPPRRPLCRAPPPGPAALAALRHWGTLGPEGAARGNSHGRRRRPGRAALRRARRMWRGGGGHVAFRPEGSGCRSPRGGSSSPAGERPSGKRGAFGARCRGEETTPNPQPSEEEKAEPAAPSQEVASPEQYIKHPLQNRWALWFFKNDKSKTWQANLRLISKFDTVEDFWALYNHIQLSSNLMPGCDYSLFKDGIEPMWEDEKNKRGGRWLITLNKQQRRSDLDRFWLETLLCLIGESFDDYSDDVCGAVVNVRTKGDKIAIWTTECENRDAVTHIGRVYKERLGLPPKIVIGYQSHADTATKSGSTTKNRFVV